MPMDSGHKSPDLGQGQNLGSALSCRFSFTIKLYKVTLSLWIGEYFIRGRIAPSRRQTDSKPNSKDTGLIYVKFWFKTHFCNHSQ